MAIFDLFSKKQKRLRGEVNDVYQYKDIPQGLRVQVVHILNDAIGKAKDFYGSNRGEPEDIFKFINETLSREYGVFVLIDNYNTYREAVMNYFLTEKDTERVVDVIQLSFQYVNTVIRKDYQNYTYRNEVKSDPDEAIEELNPRFKQHSVGFQFDGGEIIKVDSTYTHAEIVKPVLILLSKSKFSGANDEYLKAHEHYRHGQNKECLNDCLKAFESVMKIICKEKSWTFSQTDTSKKLIQICLQNNLIPGFTQNQFTSLQNLLESGIPTIRNKLGGHGQGQIPQKVDDEMTRYALNLTGTNIIFLIEQSGL